MAVILSIINRKISIPAHILMCTAKSSLLLSLATKVINSAPKAKPQPLQCPCFPPKAKALFLQR